MPNEDKGFFGLKDVFKGSSSTKPKKRTYSNDSLETLKILGMDVNAPHPELEAAKKRHIADRATSAKNPGFGTQNEGKNIEPVPTIKVRTKYGLATVDAPGWKSKSPEGKAAFYNKSQKDIEDHQASLKTKPIKPSVPELDTNLTPKPYAGDAQAVGDLIQNKFEDDFKTAKSITIPAMVDRATGGKFTGAIRSASESVKGLEDSLLNKLIPAKTKTEYKEGMDGSFRVMPPTPAGIPKDKSSNGVVSDLTNPFKIIEGVTHPVSGLVDSAADVVDPKAGALQTGLGAANIAGAVFGAKAGLGKLKSLIHEPVGTGALHGFGEEVSVPKSQLAEGKVNLAPENPTATIRPQVNQMDKAALARASARASKFTDDLIKQVSEAKNTLRPKSAYYRRLDILQKELVRAKTNGSIHPEVQGMLDEYNQKMGLAQPIETKVVPKIKPTESPLATNEAKVESVDASNSTIRVKAGSREVPGTTTTQKTSITPKVPENATSSNLGSNAVKDLPVVESTSARKAQLAGDRELLGLSELDDTVHKSFGESLNNAHKKGYTKPEWVIAESKKIDKAPRALSDEETAGMINHLSTIKAKHKQLFDSLEKIDDPEQIANVRHQLEGMESDFDLISSSVKKSGTEKGRALVSQKLTLNEVNDIISTKNSLKVASGDKLSKADNIKAEQIGKDLEDAHARITALEEQTSSLGQLVAELKARTPGKTGTRTIRTATIQVRRQNAVKNIKDKWSGYKSETDGVASMVVPGGKVIADTAGKLASIAPDVKELIKTYVEEGFDTIKDILPKLHKDTGVKLSEDDLNLILGNEYPKKGKVYEFSDIENEYNKAVLKDLRKQANRSEPVQRAKIDKVIARYEKQIADQKLPPAKTPMPTSLELEKAKIRLESARIQREDMVRQLKEKRDFKENPGLYVWNHVTDIPKAAVLSMDNSAALTHGNFVALSNPVVWARATGASIKALGSKKARDQSLAWVRSRPHYDQAVASKVAGISSRDLTEPNFGGVLTKIPIIGQGFKSADRGFETWGAVGRMILFEKMAKQQEHSWMRRFIKTPVTRETYDAIGEAVNTMTGKGTGKLAKGLTSIPIVNKATIAPGYAVSRWKLALGSPVLNAAVRKDPVLAARIIKDYAQYGAVAYGGMKLAERNGASVDFDSKSTNFMKIKLPGSSVYIDPFGGVFAPMKIMAQLMPGSKKDPAIVAGFYATGKASPIVRGAFNYKAGVEKKNQFGKTYDMTTPEGKKNSVLQFAPLSVQNGKEIMEDKTLSNDQKAVLILASFFGANVNVKDGADKK